MTEWSGLHLDQTISQKSQEEGVCFSVNLAKGCLFNKMRMMKKREKGPGSTIKLQLSLWKAKTVTQINTNRKGILLITEKTGEGIRTMFLASNIHTEDRKETNASCLSFRRWRRKVMKLQTVNSKPMNRAHSEMKWCPQELAWVHKNGCHPLDWPQPVSPGQRLCLGFRKACDSLLWLPYGWNTEHGVYGYKADWIHIWPYR